MDLLSGVEGRNPYATDFKPNLLFPPRPGCLLLPGRTCTGGRWCLLRIPRRQPFLLSSGAPVSTRRSRAADCCLSRALPCGEQLTQKIAFLLRIDFQYADFFSRKNGRVFQKSGILLSAAGRKNAAREIEQRAGILHDIRNTYSCD